ncbi:MAG: PAM68 family protein [Vulcanococcus sp.]|uniref:PAM68 family protein n=1 Tax=Vulcanococcus sp. TaxID=2856995 RepID=UPI0025F52C9A|nr:PAM68 family protein [Vulcanococcus sp.]MBW0167865.1 PAM68 family protein [Vulcanococcus sp.]
MAGKGKNRTSGGGGLGPQPPASLNKTKAKAQQTIPDYVANRMARRVGVATGIPSILGMSTFVASYLLVSKGVLDIPPGITLVTSGGFFLLGLVGLSYGVLSASWEPGAGSLLGIEQIGLNIGRLRSSIKRPPTVS